MKKTLAIATMVAMVPCAAHAKTAISDSEMNKVTGQAGVSIDVDVRFDIKADTIAWGQSDGTNTSWIGMKNFNVDKMTVKLRPDLLTAVVTDTLAAATVQADPANGTLPGLTHAQTLALAGQLAAAKQAVKPLTIDVATVGAVDEGNKKAGTTYVRFGLGSLEIAANAIDFGVGLGSTTSGSAPSAAQLSQELGNVHMGGLAVELNGSSTIDIYSTTQKVANASSGTGVVFDLNVIIDQLKAASLSWGNTAGSVTGPSTSANSAQANTSAGYVGFSNMTINDMRVVGPVSIQVATVGTAAADVTAAAGALAAAYAGGDATAKENALSAYYYSLYNSIGTGKAMGSSFVHIGLGTGNSLSGATLDGAGNLTAGALGFSMGSFNADVKVADNAGLNNGGTYGTFGINNMKVGMNGWINIGTH